MCTTQIWTYRECGCHYYHPVLCHPSFAHAATTPRRLRAGFHPSNVSSSSKRSRTPANSSKLSSNDPLAILCRQCSIQHIVHRNFLEPICDECLLQELGLQPELGPISRGRGLKEGLHGEEWLLDNSVEIDIEDSDDNLPLSTDSEEEDDKATDTGYEGDSPWWSQRRRGIDISRDSVRISSSENVMDILSDTPEKIISLYETDTEQNNEQDTHYPRWSEHLKADPERRHATRDHSAASMVDLETPKQCSRPPSSLHSPPQTATAFNCASWPLTNVQPFNITSSEVDRDEKTTSLNLTTTPPPPHQPTSHIHTTSVDSTLSTSTFRTAPSSPDGNTATVPASPPSTRPTTANSALSLQPLSTTLNISAPSRLSLTSRTSSQLSPPASSQLLHSTPPLHQSLTSIFVCVHERWAFQECGCEGPSLVKSCVCDGNTEHHEGDEDDQSDADSRDGCRAPSPIVRTRWFFNPRCEACDARDVAT